MTVERLLQALSERGPSRIAPLARDLGEDFSGLRNTLEQLESAGKVRRDHTGIWSAVEFDGDENEWEVSSKQQSVIVGEYERALTVRGAGLERFADIRLTVRTDSFAATTVASWSGEHLLLPGVPYDIFSGREVVVTHGDEEELWQIASGEDDSVFDVPWPVPQINEDIVVEPRRQRSSSETTRRLDSHQAAVVEAPAEVRLVVDAPPGTGKTHTACARAVAVAESLGYGDAYHQVLFVSFTRVAVQEIRDRIQGFVGGPAAFEILTIDQLAHRIGQQIDGSYEDGVRAAAEWLEGAGKSTVRRLKHVIVDEAQDIVGVRAGFVAAVLKSICDGGGGFTVFHDPAQAIHDWAEDAPAQTRLVDRVESEFEQGLLHRFLETIHRTDSAELKATFEAGRSLALSGNLAGLEELVLALPEASSDGIMALASQSESVFILTRNRAEAMRWSTDLAQGDVTHRLRFGRAPERVPAWVAVIANTVAKRKIEWSKFYRAWRSTPYPHLLAGWYVDDAWQLMDAYKRKGVLDCYSVSEALSDYRPPAALARGAVGRGNITVGTIHGVKGREADHVLLCTHGMFGRKPADQEEEARVRFVGLSRARTTISRTDGWDSPATNLPSGRPWRKTRKGDQQMLFGLSGDVSGTAGVGVRAGEMNVQGAIAALRFGAPVDCVYREDAYQLSVEGVPLAQFSSHVVNDLYELRDRTRKHARGLPPEIRHLYCIDVGTVSADRNKIAMMDLKAPFSETALAETIRRWPDQRLLLRYR